MLTSRWAEGASYPAGRATPRGRVREALMATPPGRPIKGESSCGGPQPDFCEPTVGFYSMAIRATMDLSAIYEVSTG